MKNTRNHEKTGINALGNVRQTTLEVVANDGCNSVGSGIQKVESLENFFK